MTKRRFPGVVRDGAKAAGGGPQVRRPNGCAGPSTPVPGQPPGYQPFVGPVCSQDGKAAIVTAYIRGNGQGDTILDPVDHWRDLVSDPGGGLEVKITGGAGYSADAIKVFEGINGTLLLAAVSLVIVLLILIYRSPIFLFVPLTAVIFAELLARSLGYGLSEIGVTINSQSSSIMSVLVLGAGTDYALLIVARYREELHHRLDRHEAMAAAMSSAGPAVLASAATVIAGLLCLTIAKVNGTSGMGPIAAMGVACAALSMLTLLPALLTICGRRAFWPFVPHSTQWMAREGVTAGRLRRRIVEGSRFAALLPVLGRRARGAAPAAARDPERADHAADPWPRAVADPRPARPRALQAVRGAPLQARADRGRDARVLEPGGPMGRTAPGAYRGRRRSLILLIFCSGLAFYSTDLTTNDSYRTKVESVEGQDILARSFPAGASAPTDIVVPDPAAVQAVRRAVAGRRRGGARQRAGGPGRARRAHPGGARAAAVLDGCLRPDRPDPRRGARGGRGHARRRADRGRVRRPRGRGAGTPR